MAVNNWLSGVRPNFGFAFMSPEEFIANPYLYDAGFGPIYLDINKAIVSQFGNFSLVINYIPSLIELPMHEGIALWHPGIFQGPAIQI